MVLKQGTFSYVQLTRESNENRINVGVFFCPLKEALREKKYVFLRELFVYFDCVSTELPFNNKNCKFLHRPIESVQ